MMQAEQGSKYWCWGVKWRSGSPQQNVMAPSWEPPARSMANPEQPPASCFTADWGETIKKSVPFVVCGAGARRWQEAHTLQQCMKKCKQASSSGQGGDLQELPGIPGHWVHSEGREGIIYSGDSCWWNWTRHIYEKIVLKFSLRMICDNSPM